MASVPGLSAVSRTTRCRWSASVPRTQGGPENPLRCSSSALQPSQWIPLRPQWFHKYGQELFHDCPGKRAIGVTTFST